MTETPLPELDDLIERFDHVSVAVNSIRGALPLVSLLEGRFRDGGIQPSGGFRWVQFDLPGTGRLELIEPLPDVAADNFLIRFLETKGEGIHHVTLKVYDLDLAVARATSLGLDVVGVDTSYENWQEAFVHPKSASGVLVQIAQWTENPPSGRQLEDVLDGDPS